jgi:hypothetical protein
MKERQTLSRREFTVASALAVLSGVTITISACGGGSRMPSSPSAPGSPGSQPAAGNGDKVGAISANHGHVAIITAARLTAGGALSLDIQGNADHPHTLELSAADMTAIAGGQTVSTVSTTVLSHAHTVTFS